MNKYPQLSIWHNTLMTLRHEPLSYTIAALLVLCFIPVLFCTFFIKMYDIGNLTIHSREETRQVANLHNQILIPSKNSALNIKQWNLFGSNLAPIAALSHFTLLGIEYSGKDKSHAKAIISTNSGEGELYGVGDKLSSDASIESVGPNEVILLYNGIPQTLSLTWEDNNSDKDATTSNIVTPIGESPSPPMASSPLERGYDPTSTPFMTRNPKHNPFTGSRFHQLRGD